MKPIQDIKKEYKKFFTYHQEQSKEHAERYICGIACSIIDRVLYEIPDSLEQVNHHQSELELMELAGNNIETFNEI